MCSKFMMKNQLIRLKTWMKFKRKLNKLIKPNYCLLAKVFFCFIIYCKLDNSLGFLVFLKWLLLIVNVDFLVFFIILYF